MELDPPQHTRLRRLTAPAFRPKLVREFAPVVEEVLTEIMDRIERQDRFDLMSELAGTFPIAVISRLLGIPAADATHFSEIGKLVGQSLDGVRTVRQAQDLRRAGSELAALFRRLADERRAEPRIVRRSVCWPEPRTSSPASSTGRLVAPAGSCWWPVSRPRST